MTLFLQSLRSHQLSQLPLKDHERILMSKVSFHKK